MFTPKAMAIKMSKKNSADDSKKLVTGWAKYFSSTERYNLVLSENGS